MDRNLVTASKFLAKHLRHAPDALGLTLQPGGWVSVDDLLAAASGGKIIKPAQDVFWGGHSGYFADPDGHLWEVCWNPHFPLAADGSVLIP